MAPVLGALGVASFVLGVVVVGAVVVGFAARGWGIFYIASFIFVLLRIAASSISFLSNFLGVLLTTSFLIDHVIFIYDYSGWPNVMECSPWMDSL